MDPPPEMAVHADIAGSPFEAAEEKQGQEREAAAAKNPALTAAEEEGNRRQHDEAHQYRKGNPAANRAPREAHQQGDEAGDGERRNRPGGDRHSAPAIELHVGGPSVAGYRADRDEHAGAQRQLQHPRRDHRRESRHELEWPYDDRYVDPGVPVHVARPDVARAEVAQVEPIALTADQQPAHGQPADEVRGEAPGRHNPRGDHDSQSCRFRTVENIDRSCARRRRWCGAAGGPGAGDRAVPQRIRVGGKEFIDDGSHDAYPAFYALLRAGGLTATSTPSPGSYLEAFRRTEACDDRLPHDPGALERDALDGNPRCRHARGRGGAAGSRSSTRAPRWPDSHWGDYRPTELAIIK